LEIAKAHIGWSVGWWVHCGKKLAAAGLFLEVFAHHCTSAWWLDVCPSLPICFGGLGLGILLLDGGWLRHALRKALIVGWLDGWLDGYIPGIEDWSVCYAEETDSFSFISMSVLLDVLA